MATVLHFKGDPTRTMQDVRTALLRQLTGEPVAEIAHALPGTEVLLLSREKYYLRNSSYAGLQILLCRSADAFTADIIGSSGGAGLLNWSMGANAKQAQEAAAILEQQGFARAEG